MCGRYVSPETAAMEREWHLGRGDANPFRRRFNVLPTTQVPVIRAGPAARRLELAEARWGFIPAWWKKAKPPSNCFNARSEEVAAKPMWRQSFRTLRCLIPAEGWYEWRAAERTDPATGEIKPIRQPHFIFRPDREPICFAGLMSARHLGDEQALSCAILTRAASPPLAETFERMPVVLPRSAFEAWLDPARQQGERIGEILQQAELLFEHYPVSPRLNAAKTDEECFLEAVQG
jgi:putative SOS response-associated peptidase YedK